MVHLPQPLQQLPIIPRMPDIIDTIRQNQVTVIIGATGSGKTTMTGLHLLDAGLAQHARIGVTQPRRLAVISVAEFVSELYGCRVGEEVGYQIRFDDSTMEGTKLKFMTEGILLQEAMSDALFTKYQVLIFDEAHEQGLNTDICLGLAKRAIAQRPDLKVVVMSATIDTGRYSEYFNQAPVIQVEGRTYPIATKFMTLEEEAAALTEFPPVDSRQPLPSYAALKVQQILKDKQPGHVLIFMPGKREIGQTIEHVEKLDQTQILPLPAHSEMDQDDQHRILEPSDKRKVIVATNIAETSITVDQVAYVIDSGLIKHMTYDHKHGIGELKAVEHSKAGLKQRMGRAGRTQPGTYLPLFTEEEYEHGRGQYLEPGQARRPEYSTPEIQRMDLSSAVLRMSSLGMTDIEDFEFMNAPPSGAIHHAIKLLQTLGALDQAERPTEIGQQMARLPVDPRIARMILEAERFGCVEEILTISACLSTGTVFLRPIGEEAAADAVKAKLQDPRGDLFTLLSIVPKYLKQKPSWRERWAEQHFLNQHSLEEILNINDQLRNLLQEMEIPLTSLANTKRGRKSLADEQYQRIGQAITAGLIQNVAVRTSDREYTSLSGISMRIHPASVYADRYPPILVFTEILHINDQTFAVNCQAVERSWIEHIAPHLITIETEPLIHPWKGQKVGEYTIERIGNLEIGRRYQGGRMPKHLLDQSDRQRSRKDRGQPRRFRQHPKRFTRRHK